MTDATRASITGTLRLLEANEIRARRRPFALILYCLWQFALGILISVPVHAWANAVWGQHPDGDSVLFRPGARELLAWLGTTGPAPSIVVHATLVIVVAAALTESLILGMVLCALSAGRDELGIAPRPAAMLRVAASAFGPLTLLFIAVSFTELGFAFVGLFAGSLAGPGLVARFGEASSLALRLAILAPFLLLASIIGVLGDLARASVVRRTMRAPHDTAWTHTKAAVLSIFIAERRSLARAYGAWVRRALFGLACIAAGALLTRTMGALGPSSLMAALVVHRLALVGRAAFRWSWFADASRFAARTEAEAGPSAEGPRALDDVS